MTQEQGHRCGFIALVGRTNAGKSTLVNALCGEKVSITSAKAQTTRHKIRAILRHENAQLVIIDTPGIHLWLKRRLNQVMLESALSTLADADVILFLVDAKQALTREREIPEIEAQLLEAIRESQKPCILAFNKMDLLSSAAEILPLIEVYHKAHAFLDIVALSARKRKELKQLKDKLSAALPECPALYPEAFYTDQSERFLASEIIREVIYEQMGKELPYSAVVEIDDFKSMRSRNSIEMMATIYVERESQKAIFIGKKGAAIKKLGTVARQRLAQQLQANIQLALHVKVKLDWSENLKELRAFGIADEKG